jgi:hypothetical protein
VLVLALLLGHADRKPTPSTTAGSAPAALPAISAAGPTPDTAGQTLCNKVIGALPVSLEGLAPRVVHARPDSPYVVAWGDPAVVLRCGVGRPAALVPGSADQIFSANGADGVYWLPVRTKAATVWTSVDRAVYVEVTVPASYATPPLNALATAIATVLPAVCSTDPNEADTSKLCTRRP